MSTLKLINITDQYPSADGVYHLAYYHPPTSGEQDQISKYLLDFADGQEPQTTQWIRLAALLVSQSLSFDIIVRPLPINEFSPKKIGSLEKLCIAIARKSGAKYQRSRLQRTKATSQFAFAHPGQPLEDAPDAYEFADDFSTGITRVLVVDDFVVNQPTLTAIARAIQAKLPQAKVLFFALGSLEEHAQNSHLDVGYFTSTTSPMRADAGGIVAHNGAKRKTAMKRISASFAYKRGQKQTRRPLKMPQVRTVQRVGVWSAILVTVAGVALLSGGYMMFAKRLPSSDPGFYQVSAMTVSGTNEPALTEPSAPSATPSRASVERVGPNLPMGVVTVPSAGLRKEHFVDAKVLKATVRSGEKVYIIKKVSSSTGPRWVQIQTKNGKVGWVWASVIRDIKPKVVASR